MEFSQHREAVDGGVDDVASSGITVLQRQVLQGRLME